MATVELGYGRNVRAFSYDEARFRLLAPTQAVAPLPDLEVHAALDQPIDAQPLEEIISPGERVLLVLPDVTRPSASGLIAQALVRRLVQLGIAARDIRAIFATGFRRALDADEKRDLLSPFIAQRIETIEFDPRDPSQMVQLGHTARGLPIELHRSLFDASHVILVGPISFHFLLGFTGGRELICPGLSSLRTIEELFLSTLNDGAPGSLDKNRAHEECERVAAEVAPSFLVNVVVDDRLRPTDLCAGDWRTSHRRLCAAYADTHSILIESPRPLVIVSGGGDPFDLDLFQAYDALRMAARACAEDGTIIIVGAFSEGAGAGRSPRMRDLLVAAFAEEAKKRRLVIVSELDKEQARAFGLEAAPSLEEALANVERSALGFIMPYGARFMPVIGKGAPPMPTDTA